MGAKKAIKPITDENTAAFDMNSQEIIAQKDIHIVGQRVKYVREKRGMEQMALAKMLGVKSNAAEGAGSLPNHDSRKPLTETVTYL